MTHECNVNGFCHRFILAIVVAIQIQHCSMLFVTRAAIFYCWGASKSDRPLFGTCVPSIRLQRVGVSKNVDVNMLLHVKIVQIQKNKQAISIQQLTERESILHQAMLLRYQKCYRYIIKSTILWVFVEHLNVESWFTEYWPLPRFTQNWKHSLLPLCSIQALIHFNLGWTAEQRNNCDNNNGAHCYLCTLTVHAPRDGEREHQLYANLHNYSTCP